MIEPWNSSPLLSILYYILYALRRTCTTIHQATNKPTTTVSSFQSTYECRSNCPKRWIFMAGQDSTRTMWSPYNWKCLHFLHFTLLSRFLSLYWLFSKCHFWSKARFILPQCECDTKFDVTGLFLQRMFCNEGVEHISTDANYSLGNCDVKFCIAIAIAWSMNRA